jgi:enediyne biosynthesis protein E4
MVLGIGQPTKIDWIEIEWPQPSGWVQHLADLPLDRYLTVHEGEGKWE